MPPPATCGDGIVEAPEQCDDGNRVRGDGCEWDCRLPTDHTLAVGPYSTCLANAAGVKCWGGDVLGTLGYGIAGPAGCVDGSDCARIPECCTGDDEVPAVRPHLLSDARVRSIATELATCAVLGSGEIQCWGTGAWGQLGPDVYSACAEVGIGERPCSAPGCCIGDDEPATAGPIFDLGSPAVQVVQSSLTTCALLVDGAVRCWGTEDWNTGTLGLGPGYDDTIGDDEDILDVPPVRLGGRAVYLAGGYRAVCALLENGDVRCWGACGAHPTAGPGSSCLGQGSESFDDWIGDDEVPEDRPPIPLDRPAVHVDVMPGIACAALDDGRVQCWGSLPALWTNAEGLEPTRPMWLGAPTVKIAVGAPHACALSADGDVTCWGRAWGGTLGYGDDIDRTTPSVGRHVALGGPVATLEATIYHTCAVRTDGTVLCWGHGVGGFPGDGVLGYGSLEYVGDDETPVSVGGVHVD